MTGSIETRLRKLESHTSGRPQIIWVEEGMTRADIDAEVNRRLAAGTMDPIDELYLIGWMTGNTTTHEQALAELEAEEARR